jgi:hypothetical protein
MAARVPPLNGMTIDANERLDGPTCGGRADKRRILLPIAENSALTARALERRRSMIKN